MIPIVLFDLDGTLIKPGGYRAAYRASMEYLLSQIGLSYLVPDEKITNRFEASAITSEWDMLPISLAFALTAALEESQNKSLLSDFVEAIEWSRNAGLDGRISVDYSTKISEMDGYWFDQPTPADSLLHIATTINPGLLPNLARHPLLTTLLKNSRSVDSSYTTRIFQNFVLGAELFEQTYDLPRLFHADSLMMLYDQSAVLPTVLDSIRAEIAAGHLRAVAYTARPSLPPREILEHGRQYSPEAEMALSLLGLAQLPLIGYGRLVHLADVMGDHPDRYVKPSAVQALASIAAAWIDNEWEALRWALDVFRRYGPDNAVEVSVDMTMLPQEMEVHIFEDSAGGIQAGMDAAKILSEAGMKVSLSGWGIAIDPAKKAALEEAGANVFSDVNHALDRALNIR
jgi:hypothetical protein